MKAFHPQSKSSTPSDHPRRPSHRRSSVRPPAPPVSNRLGNRQLQDVTHNRPQFQPSAPLQAKMSNSPRAQAWADLQSRMTNRAGGVAQRQPIGQMVGSPVQRQEALEDEEELQMRAASGPLQRQELEDEELMQGKFETAQCQSDMEEDELLQGKFDTVQRQELEEDGELLQGKFGPWVVSTPYQASGATEANRTGMPDRLKSGLEQLSGMDLSGVRVHHNSPKPSQLQALAYTQGQDIYMGPRQERHLPHEGWHAVQQRQGRVKPTTRIQEASINDDVGLEHEANVMGAKALQMRRPDPSTAKARQPQRHQGTMPVQTQQDHQCLTSYGTPETAASDSAVMAKRENHRTTASVGVVQRTIDEVYEAVTGSKANLRDLTTNQRELKRIVRYLVANYHWIRSEYYGNTQEERRFKLNAIRIYEYEVIPIFEYVGSDILSYISKRDESEEHVKQAKWVKKLLEKIDEPYKKFEEQIEATKRSRIAKTFEEFYGDTTQYTYATGANSGDPIPVIWYKSKDDYKPIKVPGDKTYNFPNGPTVKGKKETYTIKPNMTIPDLGVLYQNKKNVTKRTTQKDINEGLKNAGVNMDNLDGDHVQDLGFGGVDSAANYWPLDDKINRRPFNGWRNLYGLNVIKQNTNQPRTAVIDNLPGKWFKVVKVLKPSDPAIPTIGKKPDPESGAK